MEYCLDDLKNVKGKVLEVGCGGGGMIKAIGYYRHDLELTGLDISKFAIKEAKKNSKKVRFVVGDIYKLPFKDKTFDAVVAFDIVEHLENPEKAIKEIYRVLKPGGVLHLFSPCEGQEGTLNRLLRKLGWKAKEIYAGHIQYFTRIKLQKILEESKFKVDHYRWSFHPINQIIDSLFFSMLYLRGENLPSSLEVAIERNKKSILMKLFSYVKNLISAIFYYESKLLFFMPGAGVHFLAHKD